MYGKLNAILKMDMNLNNKASDICSYSDICMVKKFKSKNSLHHASRIKQAQNNIVKVPIMWNNSVK